MSDIEIYTSDTCHYCHEAKEFFEKNNIDYIEHSVSSNTEARKVLMKKGIMSVPFIIINGEEIQGFDEEQIKDKLNM